MKLVDNILKRIGLERTSQKAAVGNLKDDHIFWKTSRIIEALMGGEVKSPYEQVTWVYASVNSIATNISRVPFRLYKDRTQGRKPKAIEQGQMYELFSNPNPYMTGVQLKEATMIYLGLYGECFWIVERKNVTEIPKEIWTFNPTRFTPWFVGNVHRGWTYENNNTSINFENHEILQFKYFNPYDDLRGMSPVSAAKMAVEQDFNASVFNSAFFKNGARVGGTIEVEEELTDEAYNRLLRSLEDRHQGASKAHKIAILEGGAKFTEANLSQKDMDFISGRKLNMTEIFGVYKTNEVVLGIYDSIKSYEGIRAAHRAFWQECLLPKVYMLEEVMWSKFFSKIDGGRVWGSFDLANVESLQVDFKEKVDTAERLFKMGYPINMINDRLQLGFPYVPWGSKGFVAAGVTPVETLLSQSTSGGTDDADIDGNDPDNTPEPTQPEKVIKAFDKLEKTVVSLESKEVLVNENKNEEDAFIEMKNSKLDSFDKVQRPLEKKFLAKIRRFLFEQRKRVISSVHSNLTKDFTDVVFNSDEEEKRFKDLIFSLYLEAVHDGVEFAAEELDVEYDGNDEHLEEELNNYAEARLAIIPAEIIATIQEQLKETLTEGIAKQESPEQIVTRVREVYNTAHRRATTIARTESSSAMSAGMFLFYEAKEVQRHMWLTAKDEKVREEHRRLDGQVAVVGEFFKYAGGGASPLRFPGDSAAPAKQTINCRCITIPVK